MLRQGTTLPIPFAQWLYALPAVCIGIALALVWGRMVFMSAILAGFIVAALLIGASVGLLQIALAGGALILCMLCPLPATPTAKLAGTLSLGVYLAHPLIQSLLKRCTSLAADSLTTAILACLGGLAIALGVHLVAQRSRMQRSTLFKGKAENTIS